MRAEPRADMREHLAAILADFSDRRVPVTPLNVLSRALDTGLGEATAVQLAGMVDLVSGRVSGEIPSQHELAAA